MHSSQHNSTSWLCLIIFMFATQHKRYFFSPIGRIADASPLRLCNLVISFSSCLSCCFLALSKSTSWRITGRLRETRATGTADITDRVIAPTINYQQNNCLRICGKQKKTILILPKTFPWIQLFSNNWGCHTVDKYKLNKNKTSTSRTHHFWLLSTLSHICTTVHDSHHIVHSIYDLAHVMSMLDSKNNQKQLG